MMIEIIGYWFCVLAAFFALSGLTAFVAYLNVLSTRYFLDMCGGWAVFIRYKKWLRSNKYLKGSTDKANT